MKKHIYISLFAIFIFGSVHAQKAGYLGKKFIAGYSVNTLSTFMVPVLYEFVMEGYKVKPGLNLQHNLHANFIFAPMSTVGIEYGYEFLTPQLKDLNFSNSGYNSRYVANTIGLNFTTYGLFKNAMSAPIGNYIRFKYFRTYSYFKDPLGFSQLFQEYNYQRANVPEEIRAGTYIQDGIGLGYGFTQVIKDRIILDFGLEANAFIYQRGTTVTTQESSSSVDRTVLLFQRYSNANHTMKLKLGISGLLF